MSVSATPSAAGARSAELYRRALKLLPGGVNSPVRAMRAIGRDPIFIDRGAGAELIDVDGNRYVDYVCSWGPLIHGHAHPAVVDAVGKALAKGTSFGAPTAGEVELAGAVSDRMPGVEMLRMTSSGTEATMTAIRLARAATSREPVLKFAGAYHGHVDGLLAEAGSGLATQSLPASPGVTREAAAGTVVVPWNDPDALRAATERYEFAAILAEPLPANMGVVPPAAGFIELLRESADAERSAARARRGHKRVPRGPRGRAGARRGDGRPDDHGEDHRRRAARGRGRRAGRGARDARSRRRGLPGGNALGQPARGRRRARDARVAGRAPPTSGWRPPPSAWPRGLREAAEGYPVQVQSAPGLLTVFFSERSVASFEDARACDLGAYAAWCRELLAQGIYPPASQFEAWFPSLAHSDEQIERTVAAAAAAFARVCVRAGAAR